MEGDEVEGSRGRELEEKEKVKKVGETGEGQVNRELGSAYFVD